MVIMVDLLFPRTHSVLAAFIALLLAGSAAHGAQSVGLGWDASQSSDVAGYKVYSGTASGVYTAVSDEGPSTTGTLANLADATTYYFSVTAYDAAGDESAGSNEISFTTAAAPVPMIGITSPGDGSTLAEPATMALSATASETGGSIATVDFYNGSTFLGEATASPYTVGWSGVAAGTYPITAVATDANGVTTTSAPVNVTVAMATPAVSSIQMNADGSLGFTVDGGVDGANRTYDVWVSSDLESWTLLQTLSSTTNTFALSDAAASSVVSRFYRVSVQ
jgi:hypothetical protein